MTRKTVKVNLYPFLANICVRKWRRTESGKYKTTTSKKKVMFSNFYDPKGKLLKKKKKVS